MSVFNTVREMMVKNGSPTRGTRLRYSNPETGESIKVTMFGVSPDLSPESLRKTGVEKGFSGDVQVRKENGVTVDDKVDMNGESAGLVIDMLMNVETPVV